MSDSTQILKRKKDINSQLIEKKTKTTMIQSTFPNRSLLMGRADVERKEVEMTLISDNREHNVVT